MSPRRRPRHVEEEEDEEEELERLSLKSSRLTNADIVERLMNYGNPLKQIIIMTAIEKYPEMCIKAGPEVFESGLISGEGWIRACKEILREMAEMRGR
jgi:hypothetical protein